jgi:hypothetical protein
VNSNKPGGVRFFLANALLHWLTLFAMSLAAAAVANGIFDVPFGNVVDTVLALQFAFLASWLLAISLSLLEALVVTRDLGAVGKCIVAYVLCGLLPYSSIAGFAVFGLVASQDLNGATHIYLPMAHAYLGALLSLGLVPEHLQDPVVMGLIPIDDDTQAQTSAAAGMLQVYLIVASLITAAASAWLFRRRAQLLPAQ